MSKRYRVEGTDAEDGPFSWRVRDTETDTLIHRSLTAREAHESAARLNARVTPPEQAFVEQKFARTGVRPAERESAGESAKNS